MNNSNHIDLLQPGQSLYLRHEQQSMQRLFRMRIMCDLRPSVLVARWQLLYDRILFVRHAANDIDSDSDNDSDLPDLVHPYDDDSDFPDLADISDSDLPELVD